MSSSPPRAQTSTLRLAATRLMVRAASGLTGPFDAELHHGQTVALLGGPGEAASALLEALAGRRSPHSGQVLYHLSGAPRAAASSRAHAAFVGARAALPDGCRVHEVVALEARLRGSQNQGCLEAFSLGHLADRRTDTLSRAEHRAVALAMALGGNASMVFVDEPLTELAPEAVAALRGGLRHTPQRRLLVLATHSAELARDVADEVLVLRGGRVAARLPAASSALDREVLLCVQVGRGGRELAARLAVASEVAGLEWQPRSGEDPAVAQLWVRGRALDPLGRAVARAVRQARAEVLGMTRAMWPHDQRLAALSGAQHWSSQNPAEQAYAAGWQWAQRQSPPQPMLTEKAAPHGAPPSVALPPESIPIAPISSVIDSQVATPLREVPTSLAPETPLAATPAAEQTAITAEVEVLALVQSAEPVAADPRRSAPPAPDPNAPTETGGVLVSPRPRPTLRRVRPSNAPPAADDPNDAPPASDPATGTPPSHNP